MERKSVQRKKVEVDNLTEKFKTAQTIVAFDYPGLTVEKFTELRSQLRKAGVETKVYKNNISRRASIAAGYGALANEFVGPKAIAMSFDDVIAPAKIINDFAKANKSVQIAGGVIEGKVVGVADIIALASTPSQEVLLTQLAVGLLMPVRDLAIGLHLLVEEKEQQNN